MFRHLYQNPPAAIAFAEGNKVSDEELKEALKHFEQFYEEIFVELSDFGELLELWVVDNLGDHLIGNVYAKFADEESASKAYNSLSGKYYHSNLVDEEYCPLMNIKDGRCKKFAEGFCMRGAMCDFLHFKPVDKKLIQSLKDEMYEKHPEYKNRINNFNKKKIRKHEHTSSESSLERYDGFTRKRIIQRWNDEYRSEKRIEDKRKKLAQNKIDLAILEKKLMKNYEEDYNKMTQRKRKIEIKKEYDSDDEETISNQDN